MDSILRIISGKRKGETFHLAVGQRIVIGRDISSDVQMFDPGLSRTHMMIESTPEGVTVTDLNSSNGTYVNSRRTAKQKLNFGDIVQVGEVQIRFEKAERQSGDDPLVDMVQNLFDDSKPKIKKRFQVSDSGLLDLSKLDKKGKSTEAIAKNLDAIYKVSALINTYEDLGSIFNKLMDTIYEVFEADRSFLIMQDTEKDILEPVVIRKSPGDRTADRRLNISTNIVKEAVKNGLSVMSSDAMKDDRFKTGDSIIMNHIRSVMCVPVESREQILGAIYVDSISFSNVFTEDDLELLTAVGKQAGVAIQRAKLVEDLEKLYYSLIQTLVATIEAKDKYTKGHSDRVTTYAVILAQALRLEGEEVNSIRLAGLLHDIGKISIPESVLNKPDKLSAEEWALVKKHPEIGANILGNISNIKEELIQLVKHHHERYDGHGYPLGLKGENIPFGARVLAVADTFDAMTSERPYRKSLPMEVVIKEFRDNLGTQFDRKIAEVFLWLLEKGKITPDLDKGAGPSDK